MATSTSTHRGLSQCRTDDDTPPPHVLLHSPQDDQAPQAPSTPAGRVPKADADGPVSSDGESGAAHGLEEARAPLGVSEQDLDEPELSMPEPAPLGADKKAAEKKRVEKVGAKGSAAGPPVPRSLPVQRKVEPPGLDPAEEPLLWEGLTLNKCILVASVVALLSVTFQVLQAPCSRDGVSPGRQDPPPPPLHEVVSAEEEEVQEVVMAQPAHPESSMFKDDDGDGDDGDDDSDDDDDDEADSNLAEPWIFKKWFGRSTPEDEDEEPVDVPEVPLAVTEVKKSQEKKPEKTEKEEKLEKEDKAREKPEKEEKEDTPEEEEKEEKPREKKKKKKEEKGRERRATQEWSSRREAGAKDRALGDRPGRALRAPREPKQPPQKQRGREGRERRRERDEPRREGWKGRPGRAEGGRESPTRDWRQHKGRRPWEPAATPGREGTARHREGKRRD
ncbi:cilia- and flagella-associated protein 251 isoform X3 [Columba livia]|uniref:cilia- and flagella-associated protein 251 isoform X3 n=1 Tax=Columba livia TaxID=8932 RepID=UPI0031B9B511